MRADIHSLTQVLETQMDRENRVKLNLSISINASRIRDFTRMNPPTFFGSRVEEDPQGFIDEVFNIVDAMVVSSQEKAELAAYQLKDVAQVWYEKWKNERSVIECRITWGDFKTTLPDRLFPLELRERKIQ